MISVHNLTKSYTLYDHPMDRLKEALHPFHKTYHHDFYAIKNVGFTLETGEVLGIVGNNGAGKSTLLKMITGVLTPTSGNVKVEGKISSLLELGAGFNAEYTGMENIYFQGTLLGYTRLEMAKKVDAIIEYADIGDFIHQSVKTYSSGMMVRLAFSIAINVEPDILIIDEALSVGDGTFARKSFNSIMEMKNKGVTILFCSHNMYQIEVLCSKAIWLDHGELKMIGAPQEVIVAYVDFMETKNHELQHTKSSKKNAPAETQIVDGYFENSEGDKLKRTTGKTGETFSFVVEFRSDVMDAIPSVAFTILTSSGMTVCSNATYTTDFTIKQDTAGLSKVRLIMNELPLLKGTYYISLFLLTPDEGLMLDTWPYALEVLVTQDGYEQGVFTLTKRHHWSNILE